MCLHLLLPKVDPKAMAVPSKCAYADCTGKQVSKAVRDTVYRLRLLYLDRWNLWSRLTRYRKKKMG